MLMPKNVNNDVSKDSPIDESDDCEDHFTSSLFQERCLRILTQNTFPSDLAYNQH